eukprot:TRINITY_DN76636_c0_g1_i1.p1 TRINITY_DN76636_c0_g1~~TRINITY_DN76636_c0_g1_i1.p1  ORF type:complete len:539 (-),score=97.93 TRINITY_DN76636_c0_g1_i1:47-1663(-)
MHSLLIHVASLTLLLVSLPRYPAGGYVDPANITVDSYHGQREKKPLWTAELLSGLVDKYRDEIVHLRTELAAARQATLALGGKVEGVPYLYNKDADHGSTVFLTMCAGGMYFDTYCGPLFASFERAYGAAVVKHRFVAFTLHVPLQTLESARKRFSPWGLFQNLTDYITDAHIDGGTEQHYGEQTEMDSGSIVCGKKHGVKMCEVPSYGQANRDKKTELDSLWFPNAVAAYLENESEGFKFAVLTDSDMLFVGPLGQYLRANSEDAAGPPDWDVAFTVYDPDFHVPWHDDPAEAGRTLGGYSRINCGVVLLNLENTNTVVRFMKKWTHVSGVLTEVHQAFVKDADVTESTRSSAAANLSIWVKWQHELVEEFRGNDQAGLALLVSSYRTGDLKYLLGWGEQCLLCQESWTSQLKCYTGEKELAVRFRALPARVLNHPEAMVDGAFPKDLLIVHMKGLWWRVAIGKGILTTTATRDPSWARDALGLYKLVFETWQLGLPEEHRLQSTLIFMDEKGNDITSMFRDQAKAKGGEGAKEKTG